MMSFWQRLYCHLWFRIHMVNAYSLYHQGRMVECAEQESLAYELERRLIVDNMNRRLTA